MSINRLIARVDAWQQRHRWPAFGHAVIKKYGDDAAGYDAALLTYYAFLALFPLLLILTTITGSVLGADSELRQTIIRGLTDYFPVLGGQLTADVNQLRSSGLALVAGMLFTFYGARGVADAWRHAVHDIWRVPRRQRAGFPQSHLKSLAMIIVGGLGFILASVSAGLAAAAGRGIEWSILSVAINLFILFWLFTFLLKFNLPRQVGYRQTWTGAATAATGLLILQSVGGYILAHELKNLDALYSYFALPLGLLFWLYLQAQVLCLAAEIAAVRAQKLWPRSLRAETPTAADRKLAPKD